VTASRDVRPARAGDADAIAAVHVAAWQHAYRGMLPSELLDGLSVEARAQRWRRQLADVESGRTWVAGEPVRGFVSVGPSRDEDAVEGTGEVYALYVHPDAWGTGLGSRLMTAGLGVLEDGVTLWVLEANERARRFYGRHGWRPDGVRRQETRGAVVLDEVRYRLERVTAAE
jgi:ribosomal protein S18 acetylase RimI-like enzyme